jgi:Kef-type K+ transport system membrane component KefB/predicted transcriptional regulator
MLGPADPALLAALMLLAAIAGGYAGTLLRVPRVVGYLLGGIALRYILIYAESQRLDAPLSAGFETALGHLHSIRTVALGLIMFSIGNVFEAQHIHNLAPRVLRISFAKLACVTLLVGSACTLLAFFCQHHAPGDALAFGTLLGIVAVATAPAATLLVLREYEAKGSNSDGILTLTAINNVICIILFHAAFIILSGTGLIESSYSTGRWLWLDLLVTALGSVALGVAIGFALSVVYVKITIADFMLLFFGVFVLLGVFRDALAEHWHLSYSFLLTSLFIGATFANITPDQQPFYNGLRTIAGPIFALFFVLAGFKLHLGELLHVGWLGVAYIALRIVGKLLGGWLGVRWARATEYVPFIGGGMLCQAGVAIGLAAFVATTWGAVVDGRFVPHPAAAAFQTIILGSVVVFELIGPISLKQIAVQCGEVKAVTLLRRRRTPGHESESVWHQAWEALVRTFSSGGRRIPQADVPMQARHIMRSNVKLLDASARFDEVLHFAESSRFNHFPVVDEDGAYVGMIHYSDLRHIIYTPEIRNLVTASDLARTDTPTVQRDTALQQIFDRFHDHDVGSIAVLEAPPSGRVVGVVEQRDLLLAVRADQDRPQSAAPR